MSDPKATRRLRALSRFPGDADVSPKRLIILIIPLPAAAAYCPTSGHFLQLVPALRRSPPNQQVAAQVRLACQQLAPPAPIVGSIAIALGNVWPLCKLQLTTAIIIIIVITRDANKAARRRQSEEISSGLGAGREQWLRRSLGARWVT